MAKFNVVQKQRRAAIADQKRAKHGDPLTRKLKQKKDGALSISGKRKRKLFKKWRKDQKEALEKGLITMQDVQMAVEDDNDDDDDDDDDDDHGTSASASKQSPKTFHLKKSSKLKLRQLKKKDKKKRKSDKRAAEASADAMEE